MIDLDESIAPLPVADVDYRSLSSQPSAQEYFVLSRITGNETIGHLCATSGLGKDTTLQCLKSLLDHGLIRLPGAADSALALRPTPPEEDSGAFPRFSTPFEEFAFDPELLAQMVELEDDFKREVLYVSAFIDSVDLYKVLGVPRDADRRALRTAYFSLSKRYHPDRFFRKVLGDYGPLIERIFRNVTSAYQTLSHRQKRKDYDASLQRQAAASAPAASTPSTTSAEQERKRDLAFQIMTQRAEDAVMTGDVTGAIRDYRKALGLKRDLGVALMAARLIMAHSEFLDDAIAFARAAQKIDPSSPAPIRILGQLFEQKGLVDDALLHYEKALQYSPDDHELQARVQRLRQ